MIPKNKASTPSGTEGQSINQDPVYGTSFRKTIHLPKFPESIKHTWVVRRDEIGDEFIVLKGNSSLLREGLDHIYLISPQRIGIWLTSRQIQSRINTLTKKLSSLRVEQLGDGEAVLSCDIKCFEMLCSLVGAKRRRIVSDEHREHLKRINPALRCSKKSTGKPSRGLSKPEDKRGGQTGGLS